MYFYLAVTKNFQTALQKAYANELAQKLRFDIVISFSRAHSAGSSELGAGEAPLASRAQALAPAP